MISERMDLSLCCTKRWLWPDAMMDIADACVSKNLEVFNVVCSLNRVDNWLSTASKDIWRFFSCACIGRGGHDVVYLIGSVEVGGQVACEDGAWEWYCGEAVECSCDVCEWYCGEAVACVRDVRE